MRRWGLHSLPKSAVLPYASGVGGLSRRLLNLVQSPSGVLASRTCCRAVLNPFPHVEPGDPAIHGSTAQHGRSRAHLAATTTEHTTLQGAVGNLALSSHANCWNSDLSRPPSSSAWISHHGGPARRQRWPSPQVTSIRLDSSKCKATNEAGEELGLISSGSSAPLLSSTFLQTATASDVQA